MVALFDTAGRVDLELSGFEAIPAGDRFLLLRIGGQWSLAEGVPAPAPRLVLQHGSKRERFDVLPGAEGDYSAEWWAGFAVPLIAAETVNQYWLEAGDEARYPLPAPVQRELLDGQRPQIVVRGGRPYLLVAAGLMAAALVAVNPMLLWYSQEARAYALLVLLCSVSLLYCVRALRRGGNRDLTYWGVASALALATHYFAFFAIVAEAAILVRRRGRDCLRGLWIVALVGALLAPLAIYQMSKAHADWIANFTLGHRLWEAASAFVTGETADIIARPERPELAVVPLVLCIVAFLLLALRGGREDRRAVAVPLVVSAAVLGIPLLLAFAGKDYVLARNLLPALVPLLLVVAIAVTMPAARRLGAVIAAALFAYSLGFGLWASFSPDLQRPDWSAVASKLGGPEAPRATVTWTIGQAPLRDYLRTGAIEVKPSERYDWFVHEVAFVSYGDAPRPPRHALGPGFRETGVEDAGQLTIRRYRRPGPGLVPLRLRRLDATHLNFRSNGVLLDGIGPD